MKLPDWLFRGPVIPVAILVAAVAVVFLSSREPEGPTDPSEGAVPNEVWRCHACAKAPGKGWIPCRNVTGRGNEKGARDRVTELVCEEAGVPVDECEITSMRCRRFDGDGAGAAQGSAAPTKGGSE